MLLKNTNQALRALGGVCAIAITTVATTDLAITVQQLPLTEEENAMIQAMADPLASLPQLSQAMEAEAIPHAVMPAQEVFDHFLTLPQERKALWRTHPLVQENMLLTEMLHTHGSPDSNPHRYRSWKDVHSYNHTWGSRNQLFSQSIVLFQNLRSLYLFYMWKPADVLVHLPHLESLRVSLAYHADLSCFQVLSQLKRLKSLDLQVSLGVLSTWEPIAGVFSLSALESLKISSGLNTIPDDICRLSSLKTFVIHEYEIYEDMDVLNSPRIQVSPKAAQFLKDNKVKRGE